MSVPLSRIHQSSRTAAKEYDRINQGEAKFPVSPDIRVAQRCELLLLSKREEIAAVFRIRGTVPPKVVSAQLSHAQFARGIEACKRVILKLHGDYSEEGEAVRRETARLAHSLALAYRDLPLSLSRSAEDYTKTELSRYVGQIEGTNSFRAVPDEITKQVRSLAYSKARQNIPVGVKIGAKTGVSIIGNLSSGFDPRGAEDRE